jgi:hypothetical protein
MKQQYHIYHVGDRVQLMDNSELDTPSSQRNNLAGLVVDQVGPSAFSGQRLVCSYRKGGPYATIDAHSSAFAPLEYRGVAIMPCHNAYYSLTPFCAVLPDERPDMEGEYTWLAGHFDYIAQMIDWFLSDEYREMTL